MRIQLNSTMAIMIEECFFSKCFHKSSEAISLSHRKELDGLQKFCSIICNSTFHKYGEEKAFCHKSSMKTISRHAKRATTLNAESH